MSYTNYALFVFVMICLPLTVFSQKAECLKKEPKTEQASKSTGLRKVASGNRKINIDVHIDETQLEASIASAIESSLRAVEHYLESLEIHIEPIEINLDKLDLSLDPIAINIPDIDLNIEPIKIELEKLELDIDDMDLDFDLDDDTDDANDEAEEVIKHKNESCETNELKQKSGRDKSGKSGKEKAKGLRKIE